MTRGEFEKRHREIMKEMQVDWKIDKKLYQEVNNNRFGQRNSLISALMGYLLKKEYIK